jgi:hypothetical protein
MLRVCDRINERRFAIFRERFVTRGSVVMFAIQIM